MEETAQSTSSSGSLEKNISKDELIKSPSERSCFWCTGAVVVVFEKIILSAHHRGCMDSTPVRCGPWTADARNRFPLCPFGCAPNVLSQWTGECSRRMHDVYLGVCHTHCLPCKRIRARHTVPTLCLCADFFSLFYLNLLGVHTGALHWTGNASDRQVCIVSNLPLHTHGTVALCLSAIATHTPTGLHIRICSAAANFADPNVNNFASFAFLK